MKRTTLFLATTAVFCIILSGCLNSSNTDSNAKTTSKTETIATSVVQEVNTSGSFAETEPVTTEITEPVTTEKTEPATTETTAPVTTEKTENDVPADDSLSADFKSAMDSYEKVMNEYVDFMKKYLENPSDLTLLAAYMEYMSKYTEAMEDFEEWEETELNEAELAYYIEVQTRINQKLLEVAV